MKIKYLLLLAAGMVVYLSACKKENKQLGINNAALVGKWTEVKGHFSGNDDSGKITDTTISAASFNANDYAQFNNDYTVNIFQSGGNPAPGDAAPDLIAESTYNYSISGSVATLIHTGFISSPIELLGDTLITTRTVTLIDANNIDLHYTYINGPAKPGPGSKAAITAISDSYYIRVQ